jgi:RNA polymerase primary sigma factor
MVNQDKLKTEYAEDSLMVYFDQIRITPLLSFEEELDLSRKIEGGCQTAKQKLIESNLRLVIKIAKQYLCPGVSLLDLVQEGNLGLLQAASKYDYRKEVRFSTYASWWIRQSITRALANKKRCIRIPHRKEDLLKKIQAAYHVLTQRHMRKPMIEEIAEFLKIPRDEVLSILSLSEQVVSLDGETAVEGSTMYDIFTDFTYSPDKTFLENSLKETIEHLLSELTIREQQVIISRFGLRDQERCTLKQIAYHMGVSPETVRQIEMKAIKKLREQTKGMEDIFLVAE